VYIHRSADCRQRFQLRLLRFVHDAVGEFPSEEAPGASVFAKDAAGEVFHTFSSYARGLDILLGAYNILDLVPKGRIS
jgi:predicted dithiol-disulfide oxidoreductase (DUF899 family)